MIPPNIVSIGEVLWDLFPEGARFVSADQTMSQPGVATEVRDTVGAGDAFTAAFLIGLLRGDAHEVILARANKLAAAVCSQPGAVPDLPLPIH
jgi:sugar/nucleoside kinase (ribokinase family)|tara:strand:+ start:222 stop:500 length:279 start_codon:yes stop_codon:yes gene_type:complete